MRRSALAALGLLLCATLAWAEGEQFPLKPDFTPPCTMFWDSFSASFNVYLKNARTGTYIKIASVPSPLQGASVPVSVPCPLTPGQYYWTVRGADASGQEGPSDVAFVVSDPAAPPGFLIGATVKTTAKLNVRQAPGMTSPTAGPPQLIGTPGLLIDGPVTVTGQRWWALRYTTGVTGWSSELYLGGGQQP